MQRFPLIVLATACLAITAWSQAFDAASIKLSDPSHANQGFPIRGGPGSTDSGHVAYTNITISDMLYYAYDASSSRVSGPPWLKSGKFDIVATYPPSTTKAQFQLMFQNLLIERFHLALHHELKEVNGFEMVIGKGGAKLKKASEEDTIAATQPPSGPAISGVDEKGYMKLARPGMIYPTLQGSNGKAIHLIARAQLLSDLGKILAGFMHGPVTNASGLDDRYDFTLDFSTDAGSSPDVLDVSAPDVPTALQEQLGLKLEPKKAQIDMLVIDNADKSPSEN